MMPIIGLPIVTHKVNTECNTTFRGIEAEMETSRAMSVSVKLTGLVNGHNHRSVLQLKCLLLVDR